MVFKIINVGSNPASPALMSPNLLNCFFFMKFSLKNLMFLSFDGWVNIFRNLMQFLYYCSSFFIKLFYTEMYHFIAIIISKNHFKVFLKKNKPVFWKKFEMYDLWWYSSRISDFVFYIIVVNVCNLFYNYIKLSNFNRFYYRNQNNESRLNKMHMRAIINHSLLGIVHFWNKISLWVIPIFLGFLVIYWSLILRILTVNKIFLAWIIVFMLFYWLISGFVFFFKKYQYGKYTSAIQRFWKRSFILFWLLETCLLSVFIYLTFIASQESFFMFDQIQIYKTHLFSWRLFFLKIIPIVILLISSYFLLFLLKWNLFSKYSIWLFFITVALTYIVWLEFYQFYHIVNFYGNLNWVFDLDERIWNLELENRRTRIVNNYVMWLLILKFWHLIFVYIFWLFFVLRSWEIKKAKYPLLAANLQNLIILYLMSWLVMYTWIKFFFKKFMDIPYNWFYVNNRFFFLRVFFNDFKTYWYGCVDECVFYTKLHFTKFPFFYWIQSIKRLKYINTQKHYIKATIIKTLVTSYI